MASYDARRSGLHLAALIFSALLASACALAADTTRPAPTPYRLPWPAGQSHLCVQGNDGFVSHHGAQRYAFDFAMPVGTSVTAARSGVVVRVVDRYKARGPRARNNLVAIRHADGTIAYYLHIRTGGALVRPGERVRQGQPIASSGNVGRSLMPHLHFHVIGPSGDTIPVRFADHPRHDGVPHTFERCTSNNRLVLDARPHKR